MSSLELEGLYRLYAHDFNSVASWLASNAKACGCPPFLLSSKSWLRPERPDSSATSKAKKKKQACKDHTAGPDRVKSSTSPTSSSTGPKYMVPLEDFFTLAVYVANYRSPVVLKPDVLLHAIDRIIASRFILHCADNVGDAEPCTPPDGWSRVVRTMRAVKEVLFPSSMAAATIEVLTTLIMTPEAGPADTIPGARDVLRHLSNVGVSWSHDEAPRAFHHLLAGVPERPKKQENDPFIYEVALQTSLTDVWFAYTALLNDLQKIRRGIQIIWLKQMVGKFDVTAAAVATNIAISLGRNLIEDLSPLFEQQKDTISKVMEAFEDKTVSTTTTHKTVTSGNLYFTVYQALLEFRDCFIPDRFTFPADLPDVLRHYDANSHRQAKTEAEKRHEERRLLMGFLVQLLAAVYSEHSYPVEDEFLRAFREFEETRHVSFSLVFAAQIFLDIHHFLGAATGQSFMTLYDECDMMGSNIKLYAGYYDEKPPGKPTASETQLMRDLDRAMKPLRNDPTRKKKEQIWRDLDLPVPRTEIPNQILKDSPVLAGLYLFRLRTLMHDLGMTAANNSGSIAYCGHLYNALQEENLLARWWPDMDAELSLLGDSSFWAGGERPKTPNDCFEKFWEKFQDPVPVLGNDSSALNAHPGRIREGAPVSAMFRDQFVRGADFDWTADRVWDIVSSRRYEPAGSVKERTWKMTKVDNPLAPRSRGSNQKGKDKSKTTQIIPAKLLEALVWALHSESLELAFPHLAMHRLCLHALQGVQNICSPLFEHVRGPGYRYAVGDTDLRDTVSDILWAASISDKHPEDHMVIEAAAKGVDTMLTCRLGNHAILMTKKSAMDIQFKDNVEE